MEQVHIIGIDLANQGFQLHVARPDGSVALRKKPPDFLASQPLCLVFDRGAGSAPDRKTHHRYRARDQ